MNKSSSSEVLSKPQSRLQPGSTSTNGPRAVQSNGNQTSSTVAVKKPVSGTNMVTSKPNQTKPSPQPNIKSSSSTTTTKSVSNTTSTGANGTTNPSSSSNPLLRRMPISISNTISSTPTQTQSNLVPNTGQVTVNPKIVTKTDNVTATKPKTVPATPDIKKSTQRPPGTAERISHASCVLNKDKQHQQPGPPPRQVTSVKIPPKTPGSATKTVVPTTPAPRTTVSIPQTPSKPVGHARTPGIRQPIVKSTIADVENAEVVKPSGTRTNISLEKRGDVVTAGSIASEITAHKEPVVQSGNGQKRKAEMSIETETSKESIKPPNKKARSEENKTKNVPVTDTKNRNNTNLTAKKTTTVVDVRDDPLSSDNFEGAPEDYPKKDHLYSNEGSVDSENIEGDQSQSESESKSESETRGSIFYWLWLACEMHHGKSPPNTANVPKGEQNRVSVETLKMYEIASSIMPQNILYETGSQTEYLLEALSMSLDQKTFLGTFHRVLCPNSKLPITKAERKSLSDSNEDLDDTVWLASRNLMISFWILKEIGLLKSPFDLRKENPDVWRSTDVSDLNLKHKSVHSKLEGIDVNISNLLKGRISAVNSLLGLRKKKTIESGGIASDRTIHKGRAEIVLSEEKEEEEEEELSDKETVKAPKKSQRKKRQPKELTKPKSKIQSKGKKRKATEEEEEEGEEEEEREKEEPKFKNRSKSIKNAESKSKVNKRGNRKYNKKKDKEENIIGDGNTNEEEGTGANDESGNKKKEAPKRKSNPMKPHPYKCVATFGCQPFDLGEEELTYEQSRNIRIKPENVVMGFVPVNEDEEDDELLKKICKDLKRQVSISKKKQKSGINAENWKVVKWSLLCWTVGPSGIQTFVLGKAKAKHLWTQLGAPPVGKKGIKQVYKNIENGKKGNLLENYGRWGLCRVIKPEVDNNSSHRTLEDLLEAILTETSDKQTVLLAREIIQQRMPLCYENVPAGKVDETAIFCTIIGHPDYTKCFSKDLVVKLRKIGSVKEFLEWYKIKYNKESGSKSSAKLQKRLLLDDNEEKGEEEEEEENDTPLNRYTKSSVNIPPKKMSIKASTKNTSSTTDTASTVHYVDSEQEEKNSDGNEEGGREERNESEIQISNGEVSFSQSPIEIEQEVTIAREESQYGNIANEAQEEGGNGLGEIQHEEEVQEEREEIELINNDVDTGENHYDDSDELCQLKKALTTDVSDPEDSQVAEENEEINGECEISDRGDDYKECTESQYREEELNQNQNQDQEDYDDPTPAQKYTFQGIEYEFIEERAEVEAEAEEIAQEQEQESNELSEQEDTSM